MQLYFRLPKPIKFSGIQKPAKVFENRKAVSCDFFINQKYFINREVMKVSGTKYK